MGNRDPLGENTHKGLAAPLYGEAILQQLNSSNAIRTLIHSTANAGRFLLLMDYKNVDADPFSSIITDLAVADIDADGGFRSVSGTTVVMELNSSGLYAGSTLVVNSSGELLARQQVTTLSGGTTVHTLTAAQAGQIIEISTQAASSVFVHLPSSGNCYTGMTLEVIHNSTAAGIIHFMTTGANAGGEIHAQIDSTNTVISTGAVSNVTTGPMWWKFMCISTVGPIWALENKMTQSNNSTVQLHTIAAATTA